MTDYAAWLDSADIHHAEDTLFITTADGIKSGDHLVLYDHRRQRNPIWLDVLDVQETGWQKHKYAIGIKGDRMDELREALTYHVAGGGLTG